MNIQIPMNELKFFSARSLDPLGRTFVFKNRIFRLVDNSKRKYVEDFLNSKFYKKILEEKLIIPAWICQDLYVNDETFLIESRYVFPTSMPENWSFSMLKDAALLLLKLIKCCCQYDYRMIDGHQFNIIFEQVTPYWCDLGSFFKASSPTDDNNAFYAFIAKYYKPLLLWACGKDYSAYLILSDKTYERKLFIENHFKLPFVLRCFRWLERQLNKITQLLWGKKFLSPYIPILWYKISIQLLNISHIKTLWSNYQNDIVQAGKIPSRFYKLKEIITNHIPNIKSAIDLAGNQGEMIQYLLKEKTIESGISMDYDAVAVDKLYQKIKKNNTNILPFVDNVMAPQCCLPKECADLAIAMAITHHLILTQKYPIDYIFKTIGSFSKKNVMIEFMPKGLWNGRDEVPVPSWYTQEWFFSHFKKHFKVLYLEKIQENRVVFLGEKF